MVSARVLSGSLWPNSVGKHLIKTKAPTLHVQLLKGRWSPFPVGVCPWSSLELFQEAATWSLHDWVSLLPRVLYSSCENLLRLDHFTLLFLGKALNKISAGSRADWLGEMTAHLFTFDSVLNVSFTVVRDGSNLYNRVLRSYWISLIRKWGFPTLLMWGGKPLTFQWGWGVRETGEGGIGAAWGGSCSKTESFR